MSIEKGQAMPEGAFGVMTDSGPGRITTGELFSGKKVDAVFRARRIYAHLLE